MEYSELLNRLQQFAHAQSLTLQERLGFGIQGIVFAARKQEQNTVNWRSRFTIEKRVTFGSETRIFA